MYDALPVFLHKHITRTKAIRLALVTVSRQNSTSALTLSVAVLFEA